MPYVDLVSRDDYASLWFRTNTPYCNVSSFNPDKPTIVMLHPLHLDSTWLYPQLEDPRLSAHYNIIAFDTRLTGQSRSKVTGKSDLWVQAADLAHAFYHLQLPPAHVFACEVFSYVALRLAALFPELCLSITLCNVSSQVEPKANVDMMEELCQIWCYAQDLDTFEYSNREMLLANVGESTHPDLQDELVSFWQMTYPPFRRMHLVSFAMIVTNRTPMKPVELAAVNVPVLIVQADSNTRYPMSHAEKLVKDLVNVPGGAVLYPLKDKSASLGILSLMSASLVNQVFSKFLARQPPSRSDLRTREESLADCMSAALLKLSSFRKDSSILARDPLSPLSFSCVTNEVCRVQSDKIAAFAKGERLAFSPLGPDGRPIRKYSERQNHWLNYGKNGITHPDVLQPISEDTKSTHTANTKDSKRRTKATHGNHPTSETASYISSSNADGESVHHDHPTTNYQPMGRSRKMMFATSEQPVVKTKGLSASSAFGRVLR